jgi:hypothetical protein
MLVHRLRLVREPDEGFARRFLFWSKARSGIQSLSVQGRYECLVDFCVCLGTLFFIYLIFLFCYVRVCFEYLFVGFVGWMDGVSA